MRKRLRRKLYFLFHSLMGKWMLITCLIILPVNLFALMSVRAVGRSYMETMTEQLRNWLDSYAQELIYEDQTIHESVSDEILAKQANALYNGDSTDSILTDIRLKNIMGKIPMRLTGCTAWYIYDKTKDFVTFFYIQSPDTMPEEERIGVEKIVRSERLTDSGHFTATLPSGRSWLFMNYAYRYFTFGYLTNMDEILRQCCDNGMDFESRTSWVLADGTEAAVWPAINADEKGNDSEGILLSVEIPRLGGRIVYQISAREARLHYPATLYIYFALAILSILVIPLLFLLARRLIMNPLKTLADGMQEVKAGNLDYRIAKQYGTIQMNFLMSSFNNMTETIQHMTIASYEQEISKLQTETINAHLQVNQHMLTNSLNVVYSLIQMKRYDEAGEFTVLLMKYFQYALRKNSAIVTVREEIAFVEDYIRMQRIRLKGRFTSVYQVTEEARELEVPQLLIQGFVENAFKYAIVSDRVTEILIDVRKREGRLLVSVVDTGAGMTQDRLAALREGKMVEDAAGKHVGLWNVRKRLDYYYGADYELRISSDEGQGTMMHVSLPPHPSDKNEMAVTMERKRREEE